MKKHFFLYFILFNFVTQNLHAKEFFYEVYGLNFRFMEIQFSNNSDSKITANIVSKGLLDLFVSFKGGGSTEINKEITSYKFNYKKKKKGRATTIIFKDREVIQNYSQPPRKNKANLVPIQKHHLKNTLDPLTAINDILFSQKNELNCTKKIKVFDGSDVFYLILSQQDTKDYIVKSSKIVLKQPLKKCRLRYQAVAGHEIEDEKDYNKKYVDIFYGKQNGIYLPYLLQTKSKITIKMFLK